MARGENHSPRVLSRARQIMVQAEPGVAYSSLLQKTKNTVGLALMTIKLR
jgi:hypothetical protein